jgi:DNA topoisomerase II
LVLLFLFLSSQVRDATHQAIMKNEEIKSLVDILGLKFGTTYDDKNIKQLRYGHLMIMADQDHDGYANGGNPV